MGIMARPSVKVTAGTQHVDSQSGVAGQGNGASEQEAKHPRAGEAHGSLSSLREGPGGVIREDSPQGGDS